MCHVTLIGWRVSDKISWFTEKVFIGSHKQAHKLLAKLSNLRISKVVDTLEWLRFFTQIEISFLLQPKRRRILNHLKLQWRKHLDKQGHKGESRYSEPIVKESDTALPCDEMEFYNWISIILV